MFMVNFCFQFMIQAKQDTMFKTFIVYRDVWSTWSRESTFLADKQTFLRLANLSVGKKKRLNNEKSLVAGIIID